MLDKMIKEKEEILEKIENEVDKVIFSNYVRKLRESNARFHVNKEISDNLDYNV